MVDFTKPISNEQMVDGLKRLLHLNESLIAKCESAKLSSTDQGTCQTLNRLIDMYKQHIAMLSDSILFLGGSANGANSSKTTRPAPSSGGENSLLIEIENEECRLRKAYLDELKRLNASDEVVNVINKALLDAQDVKALLHRARRCQRAR